MTQQSNDSSYRHDLILSKTIHVLARKCCVGGQLEFPRRWQVRRVRVKLAIVVCKPSCSVAESGRSATRAGIDALLFDRKPAPARPEEQGQALGWPVGGNETWGRWRAKEDDDMNYKPEHMGFIPHRISRPVDIQDRGHEIRKVYECSCGGRLIEIYTRVRDEYEGIEQ